MADSLDLSMLAEIEHAIDTGTQGHAAGVSMRYSERIERLSRVRHHLLGHHVLSFLVGNDDRIPIFIQHILQILPSFVEHPVHAVVDTGRDIDVLEQRKTGQADLESVGHTVIQLLQSLYTQRVP